MFIRKVQHVGFQCVGLFHVNQQRLLQSLRHLLTMKAGELSTCSQNIHTIQISVQKHRLCLFTKHFSKVFPNPTRTGHQTPAAPYIFKGMRLQMFLSLEILEVS